MTQIDFLPDSYRRAQKRRGRVARTVLLTAIAAGVLVVATVGLKAHRVSLERTAARIEDTVKTEKGSLGVLAAPVQVVLAPDAGSTRARLYALGAVLEESVTEDGRIALKVRADERLLDDLEREPRCSVARAM